MNTFTTTGQLAHYLLNLVQAFFSFWFLALSLVDINSLTDGVSNALHLSMNSCVQWQALSAFLVQDTDDKLYDVTDKATALIQFTFRKGLDRQKSTWEMHHTEIMMFCGITVGCWERKLLCGSLGKDTLKRWYFRWNDNMTSRNRW